ncbi:MULTISPECIES: hypothetical protein [Burkholderia]|uniref:hypothetical protein n=1 Tax=Burkholderia TaxID=32008 RepID=UPI000B91D660|nr:MULTISPECIES: hypothetical protein [Burkholderia]EKS9794829.1 hypothetical protein [Burkholderia cepacia]EKS9802784.1 hypothetical protein [Burkholderia cepacia]EKS9809291.1 hypothetical protein [Burkholderia cepacia]EKS9818152.1 hypothetical protein [Burkholderia cepacia]EKS9824146.1 hypothetical protein [Burkholderia cepacia]
MSVIASPPPTALPAGLSTDQTFQPLHACGVPNPFFYHQFFDDFDGRVPAAAYTVSGTGAALANAAGDGGVATLSTGAAASDIAQIQTTASFTVNSTPKKVFCEARVSSAAAVSTDAWVLGLTNVNTTPFSGGITDGIWFSKAAGSSQIVLNVASGGTVASVNLPTAAYTLANATPLDLAFEVSRTGNVRAYIDKQLVGYVPQSLLGTSNGPQNVGAVAALTSPALPTANLALTAAINTGTNAAGTSMTLDFIGAFKER